MAGAGHVIINLGQWLVIGAKLFQGPADALRGGAYRAESAIPDEGR